MPSFAEKVNTQPQHCATCIHWRPTDSQPSDLSREGTCLLTVTSLGEKHEPASKAWASGYHCDNGHLTTTRDYSCNQWERR